MKNEKLSKVSKIIIVVLFLGFISGLLLLSAYRTLTDYQKYSYFENRNLAGFPVLEKEAVLDGSYFSGIEDWYRDHAAARSTVLKYHTLLNMDVLRRPVVNDVVIREGGLFLPYNRPETVNRDNIAALAETIASRLESHTALAHEMGAEFLYVAVPCQYVFYEDEYPWYLNSRAEYTEASSSALFAELESRGVDYIDMREEFAALGNRPEFSSKIDNHYGIFGAYETYRAILERYNERSGKELDILDGDEYTVTELPNNYVGSRTRKLLGLKKADEHLSIITPKEDVPFTRWNWGNENPGASVVYDLPQSEYDDVLYGLYMGGDVSITQLETERADLPKILVYGDSFTNAVESIIWYNFDSMTSIDFRHYTDKTLEELMRELEPDLVVCIRDYEALLLTTGNGQ